MERSISFRGWSVLLVLCLILGMVPVLGSVEAQAVSGVDSLTCAGFISNETAQTYIDVMMRYYINNNSKLRTALDDGLSVMFMFEGGSDYYWGGSDYTCSAYDTRDQAVMIVVQEDSSGNAYIDFYSENCSSIPGDPTWCTEGVGYSGSTTILDGIYPAYTTNHTGPYAALQLDMSASNGYGYYTPLSDPDGYKLGASGINVHTRASDIAAGSDLGWAWSEGCQVIGSGSTSSNVFNQFMQSVTGITWYPWIDYYASPKQLNTFAYTGTDVGYFVVDRQLGLMNASGTEYGSGSLTALYNKTALTNITASSTTARNNADFNTDYRDGCTFYPSHCTIKAKNTASVNSLPCAAGSNGSEKLESAAKGDLYTVTGLYCNKVGNYFYQLITKSGETGYIYAGSAEYVRVINSDIKLSEATFPDGHVAGEVFYVEGTISSTRILLTDVAVWVYSGFGSSGTKVTGSTDTVDGYSYALAGSDIDYDTAFDALSTGKYTYEISASYKSYFVNDSSSLMYAYGTKVLASEYFMVIASSVSQSSCSHTETVTTMKAATCTTAGEGIKSCSKCGLISQTTIAATGHSYGSWTTVEATCVEDGSRTRVCSACGDVQTEVLVSGGHDYDVTAHEATCSQYASYEYTCGNCGDHYLVDAKTLSSTWLEAVPEGLDESLFESKTQYRYSDYETITSFEASLDGYTQKSSQWVKTGIGTVTYVPTWSTGFSTSSSLYAQYDKASSKVTASETATTKTVIDSDSVVGYLYHHWCYDSSYYSVQSSSGSYTTFHAFYSTTAPSECTSYDSSDGSYCYPNAHTCANSDWWWPTTVYSQKYSTYKNQFTYERWTEWSDWGDDVVTASSTRKVEVRTVYRLKEALLLDHSWSEGVCTVCGTVCGHSYVDGWCSVCGMAEPIIDHYLFGYINGANYACEEDYQSLGEYKFVDGKVVVKFTQPGYVGVKSSDNEKWFMTDGYLGEETTCATLYEASTLESADKLYVPKGHEITFTLVVNDDGTLTLSYVVAVCAHDWENDTCLICGEVCGHGQWQDGDCTICGSPCSDHDYKNNVCTICGFAKPEKDHYLFGFIDGADYGCEADWENLGQYRFVDGKVTAVFQMDSYVAVKSGDNLDWYMTKGWLGYDVTAATLFDTDTGACEKLFVPGGVQVTFTLIDNGNDTYLLSYKMEAVQVTQPTLTLKYPSLSFESEILYNVYYVAEDTDDVVEMGLVTFTTELTDGTVENASDVIPGFETDGSIWRVSSNGISAKDLGDTLYFKVYAVLSDGSYVYTDMKSYSAVAYATTILNRSTSSSYMKSLVVAMLNYGAEAQLYFGHNTDSLMNAGLTADQQALVSAYDESMVDPVVDVDSTKAGSVVYDGSSYTRRAPSVSFDGAFSINYYFTTSNVPDGDVKLYYWTLEDYNAATTLKPSNASGCIIMTATETENQYWGQVSGIAAKELDETVFVAGFYYYGGKAYSTGVLNYSIGKYCEGLAAKDSSTQQALAQATAVYGYCAKEYFANL